jgi:predicted RNA-binding Zn ribbon-like protein
LKAALNDYGAGAALATGLVNTSPRVRGAGEALPTPDVLRAFLAEHGLVGEEPTAGDLREVLALRERVRGVLEAADEQAAADGANALVGEAAAGPVLDRDDSGRWRWYVRARPGATLAQRLGVLVGTGLLGTLEVLGHDRFRPCGSPECEGVFVDTSRSGRRRYCTPSLCGNRLNVARHRARRAGTAG